MEPLKKTCNTICDDFVEYTLHPSNASLSYNDREKELMSLRDEYLIILSRYTMDYMWHHDPFTLNIKENYLYGRVRIGDNIEDEWYIISLLFKLTELKQDLVVRVVDQDGEVLLIEAADHLPKWAQDPEVSDNRVYIYQNQVHLIPVAQNPSELTPIPAGKPNIDDAVSTVHRFPDATRATIQIQSAIKNRMKMYPENWSDQKQFVHMVLPEKVKCLLCLAPKHLISAAIRCFYMRDLIDMRNCRTMQNFPPENLVKVGVTLSKCLYAMLVKQDFRPDRKSGWTIPPPSPVEEYKAANLGMKLSCGFEMLLAECKVSGQMKDLDSTSNFDEIRYRKFEENLIASGYFRNELKGSKGWTTLSAEAKEYFSSAFCRSDCKDSGNCDNDNPSRQLKRLLARIEEKSFQTLQNENLPQEGELFKPPDDDSWLEYESQSFDEMLKKHFNIREESVPSANSVTSRNKEDIPVELKKFLSTMSNFEGVDTSSNNLKNNGEINFDTKEFEKAMAKMKDNDNFSDMDSSDEEGIDDGLDLGKDDEDADPEWNSYTNQLQEELQGSKVLRSNDNIELIESLDDLNSPINVDMDVLKNILESYSSQNGMPGPASTLLQSLGINISDKP